MGQSESVEVSKSCLYIHACLGVAARKFPVAILHARMYIVCAITYAYSLSATCCVDGGEREGVRDYRPISNQNLAGLM